MAITRSETGLSSDDYNALLASTKSVTPQVVAYRQTVNFYQLADTRVRDAMPFTAASDADLMVRVFNDAGTVKEEHFGRIIIGWTTATTIEADAMPDVQPKVVKEGSNWLVFLMKNDGMVYVYSSSDGVTYDSGTLWSSVTFTPGTVLSLSYAGGPLPLVYIVYATEDPCWNITALDNDDNQFDTGIYWGDAIYGFDAVDFTGKVDDTSEIYDDTDARHVLVMSALLPSSFVYDVSSGTPKKKAQASGGLLSFSVRPPNDGRPIQVSRWYNIETFDVWSEFISSRMTAHVMRSGNSIWMSGYGHEGDANSSDDSFSYEIVAYYSSQDGKNWSQSKIIPLDGATVFGVYGGLYRAGALLCPLGEYVYLLSSIATLQSKGCLDFGNTHSSLTLDITDRIISYSASMSGVRQSNFVLDNADGRLWETFLGEEGTVTFIIKLDGVQVSIEGMDSISPSQDRPREYVEVSSRDRMSRLTDEIENANAEIRDNQYAGVDIFKDLNGVSGSGLAHSDVISGTFDTAVSAPALSLRSNFKEGIRLDTTKMQVQDGHCATIVQKLPKPTDFGGTDESDSPTYAGVVFRVQDKDNLWAVWYNYWTDKIELVERRNGDNNVLHSYTPTSDFTTRARNNLSFAIRVEFKGARIKVYESTVLYTPYGVTYNPSFTFFAPTGTNKFLQGSVGLIGCGFSDKDEGNTDEPSPITIIGDLSSDFGGADSFLPTRMMAFDMYGNLIRGTGGLSGGTWTTFSMPGGVQADLQFSGGIPTNSADNSQVCVDAAQDLHDASVVYVLGPGGVAKVKNPMTGTPVWSSKSIHAPSGYTWGYYTSLFSYGRLHPQVNAPGYFGWLEYSNSNGGDLYYAWTDDYFATYNRTDTGLNIDQTMPGSISLNCFASGPGDVYVAIMMGVAFVESTNGGGSFSSPTSLFPGINENGGVWILGYSKAGGSENRDRSGFGFLEGMQTLGATGIGYFVGTGGTSSVSYGSGGYVCASPRVLQVLTIDSNHQMALEKGGIFRTEDAWATVGFQYGNGIPPSAENGRWINGWPTNKMFAVYGGNQYIMLTIDGGATKSSIYSHGTVVMTGFADFSEVYPVGGVHPVV